jgi:AraC family transcriptional regulator
MSTKIQIQELPERSVAYVSYVGNYIGNSEIFKSMFDKLFNWASPKGLLTSKTIFLSAYQDDPNVTPLNELTLKVCITVPEDIEVDGEIKKKIMPGGKYVVGNFELADPKEYGKAWNEVVDWIKQNGHTIDMSRYSYEIYRNNPEEHPEKHHLVDICMGIK